MVLIGAINPDTNVNITPRPIQVVKHITGNPIRLAIQNNLIAFIVRRLIEMDIDLAIADLLRLSLASYKQSVHVPQCYSSESLTDASIVLFLADRLRSPRAAHQVLDLELAVLALGDQGYFGAVGDVAASDDIGADDGEEGCGGGDALETHCEGGPVWVEGFSVLACGAWYLDGETWSV